MIVTSVPGCEATQDIMVIGHQCYCHHHGNHGHHHHQNSFIYFIYHTQDDVNPPDLKLFAFMTGQRYQIKDADPEMGIIQD